MGNERANILELLERTVANNMNEIRANFRFSVVIVLYTSNTLSEWGAYTSTQNSLDTYITRASSSPAMGPSPYTQHNIKIRRGMPVSTTKRVIVI